VLAADLDLQEPTTTIHAQDLYPTDALLVCAAVDDALWSPLADLPMTTDEGLPDLEGVCGIRRDLQELHEDTIDLVRMRFLEFGDASAWDGHEFRDLDPAGAIVVDRREQLLLVDDKIPGFLDLEHERAPPA